jgi:hypothetical protein
MEQNDIPGSRIDIFFLKLKYTPAPDLKKSTEKEKFVFVVKRLSGETYFFSKGFFILHFSKFYPFSLMYRENIMHASRRKLRKFIEKVERKFDKKNEFLITGSFIENDAYIFRGFFRKNPKEAELKKLEGIFRQEAGEAFAREDGMSVNIFVPYEIIKTKI